MAITSGISHREVIVAFNKVFADILLRYFKPQQAQTQSEISGLPSFIPNHQQLDTILVDPYSALGESVQAFAALLQLYKSIEDQRELVQKTVQTLADTGSEFRLKHLAGSAQLKELIQNFSEQLEQQRQQIQSLANKLDAPQAQLDEYNQQINQLTQEHETQLRALRKQMDNKLTDKIKELGYDLGIQEQQDLNMTSRAEILERYKSLNISPPPLPKKGSKEDGYYDSLAKLQLVFRSILMMETSPDE